MKPPIALAVLFAVQFLALPACAAGRQSERGAASLSTAAEHDIHATLVALERQRIAAILRRDIATLRTLMDRQYLHIESRGRARSKTELLTTLERDDFRFRSYELETIEVQPLDGGGAALVTGIFRSVQAGANRPFRGRYARIWVRQPEGWRNTFHQTTEIRAANDGCPCD